jgi:ABC-type sugar transport system ATPase subunit
MAKVTLEHVDKIYPGNVQAVADFNLEIRNGEFVVLVGPSGCGKSTLLRMVAGLEEISAGTIRIGERVVNEVPPKDRDIAMVFQNYALYPHMTVRENMAFGLKLRKFPKKEIEARVQEAVLILGLAAYRDQPVLLGLRPEDIGSSAAEQLPGAPRIRATVEVVEPMGSESYVHFKIGGTPFGSRVDAYGKFQVGQAAEPAVFIHKAHFFDPGNDKRIG